MPSSANGRLAARAWWRWAAAMGPAPARRRAPRRRRGWRHDVGAGVASGLIWDSTAYDTDGRKWSAATAYDVVDGSVRMTARSPCGPNRWRISTVFVSAGPN